jgi:very-short-patch-repair endonuclease
MPTPPIQPAVLTGQVFRGTEATRRTLLTIDELRSAAWTRVRHDVYADARLERDHELACRAALARLPPTTVIAGPSAAFLHGIEHAAAYRDDVHVITPKSARIGAQLRLRVHHLDLRPDEVDGNRMRMTTANRTAWDVARWLPPIEALPIIDEILHRDLTTLAALGDQAERYRGRRGWRRAQQVFGLAERDAQSPAESRLRVRLVLAGLPRPVAQCPVQISPALVLHTDLGWPQWRVAVEYDGHWHADPDQLHRDRQRLNRLVGAGWVVLHVTSRRLHGDFPGVQREVEAALSSRGWQPARRTIPRK